MLYDDLSKVMKVIGEIRLAIHCTVAERMVLGLAKTYALNAKPSTIMRPRVQGHDTLIVELLNKMDAIRVEVQESMFES